MPHTAERCILCEQTRWPTSLDAQERFRVPSLTSGPVPGQEQTAQQLPPSASEGTSDADGADRLLAELLSAESSSDLHQQAESPAAGSLPGETQPQAALAWQLDRPAEQASSALGGTYQALPEYFRHVGQPQVQPQEQNVLGLDTHRPLQVASSHAAQTKHGAANSAYHPSGQHRRGNSTFEEQFSGLSSVTVEPQPAAELPEELTALTSGPEAELGLFHEAGEVLSGSDEEFQQDASLIDPPAGENSHPYCHQALCLIWDNVEHLHRPALQMAASEACDMPSHAYPSCKLSHTPKMAIQLEAGAKQALDCFIQLHMSALVATQT